MQLHAIRYFRHRKPGEEDAGFWGPKLRSEGERHSSMGGSPERLEELLKQAGLPENALEGVAGMIRMGDRESPELYAALGELLAIRGDSSLAAMAYWRAMEAGSAAHPQYVEWQEAADEALFSTQGRMRRSTYETQRDHARRWVAAYQARERELLAAGSDAEDDAEYAAFYAKWGRPQVPYNPPSLVQRYAPYALLLFIPIGWLLVRLPRRRTAA